MLRKMSNHVSKRGIKLEQEGHWTGDFIIAGCNGGSRHDSLQYDRHWWCCLPVTFLLKVVSCISENLIIHMRLMYILMCKLSLQPSFEAYCKFSAFIVTQLLFTSPDNKVHGANMGPTWLLSAPDGPHVGPMNLAIREGALLRRHIS